jgi:hypothetical protein
LAKVQIFLIMDYLTVIILSVYFTAYLIGYVKFYILLFKDESTTFEKVFSLIGIFIFNIPLVAVLYELIKQ